MKQKIPVLMYHSVGMEDTNWLWSEISISVEQFEKQLKLLTRHRYESLTLYEYIEQKKNPQKKSDNKIVLTFDDGYLDNWVYVYPLLKKNGLRGTIFINPEFVDPRDITRPDIDDLLLGRCSVEDLQVPGFLSWPEIRAMQKSGVIDIQSHTMSHTWHFISEKIVDFHHPHDQYPWLAWNEKPQDKHAYLTEDQSQIVPYGAPVYEHGRALGNRRYFEDKGLTKALCEFVSSNGGIRFFKENNWRKILFTEVKKYRNKNQIYERYEPQEEFIKRNVYEIQESKRIIERQINKKADFLCWPGGALTNTAVDIARDTGYIAVTLPSKQKNSPRINDHFWIERIGASNQFKIHGSPQGYNNTYYFFSVIKYFEGHHRYIWFLRLYPRIKRILYTLKLPINR